MKLISTLLFLMAFLVEVAVSQQWYHSSPLIFNKDANSIQIFNRNAILLAGGTESVNYSFYTSNNYGANWNATLINGSASVLSMVFADSLNGVAVGEMGTLLKTSNGGNYWTGITPPVIADFNKVVYVGTQTLFAVGGNRFNDSMQLVLKSTDGGNNWSTVLNQIGKCLKSVYFTSIQNGIAVGDSGTILKTVNGGNAWAPVTSPVQRDFNAITFANDTTGYIVGGKAKNDSMRTILKTTDGGSTWIVMKDEPGAWLKDIAFINQSSGYAVGDHSGLLKTTTAGLNWNQETLHGSTGNEFFNTIKFYDPNFGVVGGKNGNVFVCTNTISPVVDVVSVNYLDSTAFFGQALIHTNGTPVVCRFDFSTSPNFTPQWITYNQYLTNDTTENMGIFLTGLTPNSNYYCRFVVNSILGTQYFDTLTFYTYTPHYTVQTDSASNINLTWAQLNGKVDKIFFTGYPYFQYSLSSNLTQGSTTHSIPLNITDTLLHSVSANLFNLMADTTYYYALMLQTPYGTISGDTISFKTHATPYIFQTQPSFNVTSSSATLNGMVDKLPTTTNLYFDYGLTPLFGNTIPASPNSVNDTLLHTVSVTLGLLLSDTTYYFRLRGTTGTITYYGSPFSFYTDNSPAVVNTLLATNIFENSVTMNGYVDKLPEIASLNFEVGTTPAFGYLSSTSIPIINDTLPHTVTGQFYPWQAGITYYYRLKAITATEVFVGNTLTFFVCNPYMVFTTGSATGVNSSNAQLNGNISGLNQSTDLSFEYGTTPILGNQIAAAPAVISDSLPHTVTASLTGLNTNAIYYYRLKGTAAGYNDFYGNIRQLYTGVSEIPNWDFQYWQEDTFTIPNYWKTITDNVEQVPGHSGSYAAKISQFNALLLGNYIDGQDNFPFFYGGQPLHFRPDSIQTYLNYNIANGDTGFMLAYMYSGSNAISYQLYPIFGSSGGNYKKVSFPITYNSAAVPDSIVIGFISSNILVGGGGNYIQNFIAVDDVSFYPNTIPVANGNFENWFPLVVNRPLAWGYSMLYYTEPASTPYDPQVSQKLFNGPADYALELKNNTVEGILTGGDVACNGNALTDRKGTFPVLAKHATFNGYYKYYPVNGDTMYLSIIMYKNGHEIGFGYLIETDTIDYFKPFDVNINYNLDSISIPDSAGIQISPRIRRAQGKSSMQLDKLSFDGFTSVDQWSTGNGIIAYPNPAQNQLMIELKNTVDEESSVQLTNTNGQVMMERKLPARQTRLELDISGLENGFYLLNIKTGNQTYNGKIVVMK